MFPLFVSNQKKKKSVITLFNSNFVLKSDLSVCTLSQRYFFFMEKVKLLYSRAEIEINSIGTEVIAFKAVSARAHTHM